MTVAACLIVKNEEATIGRCLDAAAKVADLAVIVDTGSSDDTVRVIEEHALPTVVFERPWANFGVNRSELMRLARGRADWLLLLDADQELIADGPLPEADTEAFTIRHEGGWEYDVTRVVRGDLGWWFEQPTHEYITLGREYRKLPSGWRIRHHADGGSRGDKFERDYQLLHQHYLEDPSNSRTVFYLARTCEDMGRTAEAVAWYRARSEMRETWEEERWWAQQRAAHIVAQTATQAGLGALWEAWQARPWRAEPLARIIERAEKKRWPQIRQVAAELLADCDRRDDILFVEADLYP
jgi:glycosyltransferase involved in cell wall biosynthesis